MKIDRILNWIERVGNRLPDPAVLFVLALVLAWVASAVLNEYKFEVPAADGVRPLEIESQLSGQYFRISDQSSPVAQTNPNFDSIIVDCYHGDYDQAAVDDTATGHILWSDDRRVTQSRCRPRLASEPLPFAAGALILPQNLDGDAAVELWIDRLVDDSHPSATNLALNDVPPELSAGLHADAAQARRERRAVVRRRPRWR